MKKIIASLLVLMLVTSLTACGGKSDPAESGDFTALEVNADKRVSDIVITDLKAGKDSYPADTPTTITVTVKWDGTPNDSAWVGIVPASVPHGDENQNDEADIVYYYLRELEHGGGVVTFEEITLEAGEYTIRVNEADDGGIELAWCAFNVK